MYVVRRSHLPPLVVDLGFISQYVSTQACKGHQIFDLHTGSSGFDFCCQKEKSFRKRNRPPAAFPKLDLQVLPVRSCLFDSLAMSSAQRESPKKKRKISVKPEEKEPEIEEEEDDDDDDEEDELVMEYNQDSNAFLNLGRNKRCTIRSFKGKVLIDIREFYEKNDQLLPGKKGISLSLEQFRTLKRAIKKGLIDEEVDKFD